MESQPKDQADPVGKGTTRKGERLDGGGSGLILGPLWTGAKQVIQWHLLPSSWRQEVRWDPQLCEKHFVASDYVKTSKYTYVKTGKIIELPLKFFRLKPDAVRSVFPNCPQCVSRQNACSEEAPEEKRKRVEDELLRIAMEKCLEEKQQKDKKNKVTIISEFLHALPSFNTSSFWSLINMDSKVLFLDLTAD
ncbi:hypothetical protein HPB49_006208 [Dermacentor silvarum]|uniref:Uncharacterized protein n=1 Tax=Dermacentor silvarum TaxID=543639 RepID=A0ACB8C2D3_DERSI|nr:hypothetical protein HPB49_006208 [Dermacentor silvarum]